MTIDLYVYAFFGAGLAAGRVLRIKSPWVGRFAVVSVVALLFFLGASLSGLTDAQLILGIPIGLGVAALVLAATVVVHLALFRWDRALEAHGTVPLTRPWLGGVFVPVVAAGFEVGRLIPLPSQELLAGALYVLLFLVALDFRFTRSALRDSWKPILSASAGGAFGGLVFAFVSGTPVAVALAVTLGFGWYSLTGPLVTAYAGAFLGLVGFLTNFLRENLTMVLAPALGPRVGGQPLIAMGGATSMDTTLPFIIRYGGKEWSTQAVSAGFALTLASGMLVPLLLSLPLA